MKLWHWMWVVGGERYDLITLAESAEVARTILAGHVAGALLPRDVKDALEAALKCAPVWHPAEYPVVLVVGAEMVPPLQPIASKVG